MNTDPMLKRSKDSAYMLPFWDKVDAIMDGVETVRDEPKYFPKFVDETNDEYKFRHTQTKMTNVYHDGIEGLASKPFEQTVQLMNENPPASITSLVDDVDGSSNNLHVFADNLFFNGINNALAWIFVDYSKPAGRPVSVEEARRMGQRSFWSHVLARNVLEVQSTVIAGRETLTYFRVYEPGDVDHIRIFVRDDDGTVRWALFQYGDDVVKADDAWMPGETGETRYKIIDEGTITIGVIPMVPFITGRRNGRSWKVFPPMKQAADLQIELFQQESGLKFVKTLSAYPMLAANGVKQQTDAAGKPIAVKVGPTRVLYTGVDSGTGKYGEWKYLQPDAEILKFLADDCDRTIRELRELVRQPLTAQSGNITVITAAVAADKARSAVKQWALLLKDALENAIRMSMMYERISTTEFQPNVHVFIEFDDFMEGEDVDALNKARDRGDISQETYWEEYKRRGFLSSNFTAQRETTRLLNEVPSDATNITQG